jgi:two-component system NtrC family response regulator
MLIVEDEPNIRTGLAEGLAAEVDRVDTAEDAEKALALFADFAHQIVISDIRLPGTMDGLELLRQIKETLPDTLVILITAYGSVEMAVEAMRSGAHDFVTKPVDLNILRHQVRRAAKHQTLAEENRRLRERLAEAGEDTEIIGGSKVIRDLLCSIRQVAETDATLLIFGESGVGKELVARAVHRYSSRRDKPLVTVHLGALPETLLESELFGYEKGAFTGANRRKRGRFEEACGGTLFLDEITETTAKSQVDLLRVLEQQEFRRLGGEDVIKADVRVISATNRDIDDLVRQGDFREDLYYRLNVIPLRVPPLREHPDDIPLLVDYFLQRFCQRHKRPPKRLSTEALRILTRSGWPGNVRQLRNLVERLVVTTNKDVVHIEDLPEQSSTVPLQAGGTLTHAVEDAERRAIMAALAECNYHRERTAKQLEISVRTLHYKMNRYGLH